MTGIGLPCRHSRWEPVELLVTGELVANICADCLIDLPIDYDGEVSEIRTWAGETIMFVPYPGLRLRALP